MSNDPQSGTANVPEIGRRNVLRAAVLGGTAIGGVVATTLPGARAESTPRPRRRLGTAGVRMRWLGVAGWQLTFDDHVLWFDPYLSRFDYTANGGALTVRADAIEGLLANGRISGPPEIIMISHGHFDHIADIPYLLGRPEWAGKTIHTLGSETHRNLLAAMGNTRPVIQVSGGEEFSFSNGAYTIQVIRSLHSQSFNYGFPYPGSLTAQPTTPSTIKDLLEGGTLAYLVTIPDRLSVLMFGGTNFIERELVGLRPDVAAVCMTFHNAVNHYLERLLTVLSGPLWVMPSHHDNMVTGFDDPALPGTINTSAVTELRQTVQSLRLNTQVIAPQHLTEIAF
jgi:L-ascorbate metabolism protein UlaG (beta-lactamase superfamily)